MSKKQMLPNLRFIIRDNEKILQQAYYFESGFWGSKRGYAWEDVPLITDFIEAEHESP